MPTIVSDRQITGGDWGVYLTPQANSGVIGANPVFKPFRRTEGRIKSNYSYTTSAEVSLGYAPSSQIQDGVESIAELSFEATKDSIDYLIAAIYGTEVVVEVESSLTASTATGFSSTDNAFEDFEVGDFIFATNTVNSAINGTYLILTKPNGGNITTYPVPAAIVASGAAFTIVTKRTRNANDATYYAGQTRVIDQSKVNDVDYKTFFDGLINSYSLEIGETGIIGGSQSIQFSRKVAGTGIITGQSDVAASSDAPLSSVQNLMDWFFDDSTALCAIKSATLNISNENQRDQAAGCTDRYVRGSNPVVTIEAVSRSSVADSMQIRDKYESGQRVGFALRVDHGQGQNTVIYMPRNVITAWDMADGQNVISSNEFTLTTERDPALGFYIAVYRNW